MFIPQYIERSIGPWALKKQTDLPPVIRGYFHGIQQFTKNYVLTKDGKVWMSITPMETESLSLHVKNAQGNVVIAGLGMGLLLVNVAAKPEVRSVSVIELDPSVIKLFFHILPNYEGREKVTIYQNDVTDIRGVWNDIDFLSVDIWPDLGSVRALKDVQKIQAVVKAKKVAWWGMELDFIHWCKEKKIRPDEIRQAHYLQFAADVKLPLIEQDNPNYAQMALEAARNVLLY